MVKTSPSKAVGVNLIPGQGAKIPHVSWPKILKHKTNNIVKNLIKIFKLYTSKKNFMSKNKKECIWVSDTLLKQN